MRTLGGDPVRRVVVGIDWVEDHHHWHAAVEGLPGVICGASLLRVRHAVLEAVVAVADAEGHAQVYLEGDGSPAAAQAFGTGVYLDFRARAV